MEKTPQPVEKTPQPVETRRQPVGIVSSIINDLAEKTRVSTCFSKVCPRLGEREGFPPCLSRLGRRLAKARRASTSWGSVGANRETRRGWMAGGVRGTQPGRIPREGGSIFGVILVNRRPLKRKPLNRKQKAPTSRRMECVDRFLILRRVFWWSKNINRLRRLRTCEKRPFCK